MARVKRSVHAKKKRRAVLEQAKGYTGTRRKRYRAAKEQVMHSGMYAYRDRRDRKAQFRRLWIARINAGARANGMTYATFINGLTDNVQNTTKRFGTNGHRNLRAGVGHRLATGQAIGAVHRDGAHGVLTQMLSDL